MRFKKLFLALVLIVTSVSLVSCDDEIWDDYYYVDPGDLPYPAISFINSYFYNDYVDNVQGWGYGDNTCYAVYFDSGAVAYFDAWGYWYQVDAPYGFELPAGIVPVPIVNYVYYYYPYEGVNSIIIDNYGYSVRLTNGVALSFDRYGNPY